MVAMNLGVLGIERLEVLAFLPGHFPQLRHMLAREQQLFRIEVPGPGESLRFLRTAAWVRRVHESALVLHERVQTATSARQLLPEVVAADVEQLRPDSVADAEDLSQDVDEALFAVEAQQHARRASD